MSNRRLVVPPYVAETETMSKLRPDCVVDVGRRDASDVVEVGLLVHDVFGWCGGKGFTLEIAPEL